MELETIITEIIDGEGFYSFTPLEKTYLLERREITGGILTLDDSRRLSAVQRKAIYAIIGDIADWTGYVPEECKEVMKWQFCADTGEYFSLSNCDMTTAFEFTEWLIEFCLENSIPTKKSLREYAPEIGRYVYACLVHKKCCICNEPAEVHHVDRVQSGNNRHKINHEGMLAMPLCREHHSLCHTIPQEEFNAMHKVAGVKLDSYLCKKLKL